VGGEVFIWRKRDKASQEVLIREGGGTLLKKKGGRGALVFETSKGVQGLVRETRRGRNGGKKKLREEGQATHSVK